MTWPALAHRDGWWQNLHCVRIFSGLSSIETREVPSYLCFLHGRILDVPQKQY